MMNVESMKITSHIIMYVCVCCYIEHGAPEGDEILGDGWPGRKQDVVGVGVHPGKTERSTLPGCTARQC